RQRAGLRLAVADDAGHHQVRVVERGTVRVREAVPQLAALVDGAGHLRRDVAGDAAGEGELAEQVAHAVGVPGDVRVALGVGALQPGVRHGRGAAVAGTDDVDHVLVALADDPVQVREAEVQPGRGAPVAEQPGLDVVRAQRLAEQGVVEQVALSHRQVVGRAPEGIDVVHAGPLPPLWLSRTGSLLSLISTVRHDYLTKVRFMAFRSSQWYAGDDRNSYLHRAWMRRGLPRDAFTGERPHIAIANTASDLTPCNSHLNEVADSVKQGIWAAGGVPLNLPAVALGETNGRPTAMLWRNLAAMATEEMLRANPIDGVVLLGGCDKTIPSLLMAAASVDLPAVVMPGGPMLTGHFRGVPLGCGTDVWRLSEEVRAGTLSREAFLESESSMIRSRGHCNTMGTASTMACMAEALGMTIPGTSGTPAHDARLLERSHETGRLAVELVRENR